MSSAKPPSALRPFFAGAAFFSIVLLYCAWVLSLPLFPSQDGPVHLYYSQILSHLLSGSSPLFSQYFELRYPPPPYLVHYYLLLALSKLGGFLLAEKLFVCLIIVAFCCGFRFLATSIGSGAGWVSLWVPPLSLNWMLGMGFHNFCLSLALGLWAMGVWLRASRSRHWFWWAAFLLLLFTMLLTHPVPIPFVLAFAGCELLLRFWQGRRDGHSSSQLNFASLTHYSMDLAAIVLGGCALLYVALFLNRHAQPAAAAVPMNHVGLRVWLNYASLKTLSLVGNTKPGYLYRACFYLLLLGALALALRGIRCRWRKGKLQAGDLLLAGAFLLAVVIPFLPRNFNGSDYFSDRLIIYIWIAVLAAASRCLPLPARIQRLGALAAIAFSFGALFLTDHYIRPLSRHIQLLEKSPLPPAGPRGVFLWLPTEPENPLVSFDPYVWVSARYFRRTGTVMLNSPWLDLPILPIAPKGDHFALRFPPVLSNYPDYLYALLKRSQDARDQAAQYTDFALATGYSTPMSAPVDEVLTQPWPEPWRCTRQAWYAVCSPQPSSTKK